MVEWVSCLRTWAIFLTDYQKIRPYDALQSLDF